MISSDDQIQPSDYVQKAHANSDLDLYFKSLLADLDDTNKTHPNFSIRDYAFNSRKNDISCNWPFSLKTLKICLENEVKNLLPPFESLESLRNNSSIEEIISSSDGKLNPELTLESKTSEKSRYHLHAGLGQSKSKKPVLVSSRNPQTETAMKKCRIQPTEEVTPMASKVCPVCKTFSSSSNTTLNAHIDQCLSSESSRKWTADPEEIVKSRIIKRRKVRLMVDIYKTAPRCTVEELDARNGTSWANKSSFPAQELESQGEEATNVVRTEVADHEGDVYIDTNGTKVRILSVPKVDKISDDHQAEKKRGKSSELFMVKKKSKNHHEDTHTNNKKLCSQNSHHRAFSEVTIGERSNNEDGGKETVNRDDFPIVRPPWACSKRTALAKKLRSLRTSSRSCNKMVTISQQDSEKVETLPKLSKLGQYAKKRSQLFARPSSKHLNKEGTLLHRDRLHTCPSKQSKGSKSEGSKSLSLEEKLSPVSKGKQKNSAFSRSCVHPLSKETVVVGSFQESLQQQRGVEENTSDKTSCESLNLLEVGTNKETKIFCSRENSVASRSLIADSSCDVGESVRKETRLHEEQVRSTTPILEGIDVASLNPHNKEMVSQKPQGNLSMAPFMSRVELSQEHRYQDITDRDSMLDSPLSAVSNPSIGRSDSDKFSVRSSTSLKDETYAPISSSDWTSMQTSAFKNNNHNNTQPCFFSRKETALAQAAASSSYQGSTTLRKPVVESWPHMYSVSNETLSNLSTSPPPLPPHRECDSVGGPVLRLMGKNLTVVKADEDVPQMSPVSPFSNVLTEHKLPSFGYNFQNPNGFESHPPTFHPANSMRNHAFGTMLHSMFDDRMVMRNDPSIELHHH